MQLEINSKPSPKGEIIGVENQQFLFHLLCLQCTSITPLGAALSRRDAHHYLFQKCWTTGVCCFTCHCHKQIA